MITDIIEYEHDGVKFTGYIARPDGNEGKRPAVLVAHAWRGQDEFARKKAETLAGLGYIGFAIDMYGTGVRAKDPKEALELMLPLFLDRRLLRERVNAGLKVLQDKPYVDQRLIGAIGFCFGGLTVIELLRSGAAVKGVVSFHGLLGYKIDRYTAQRVPNSDSMKGSILILHGNDDPLVSQKDIEDIQHELTKAHVDWQMNIYGQTAHAFSNPEANDAAGGMLYNPRSADRAWLAMKNFFYEIFSF